MRSILKYGKDTLFGKEHNFSYILKAKDDVELYERYRECVKASDYEDFRPYVNRMKEGAADILFKGRPLLYATTSGATGEPKWIPISSKYISDIYGKLNKTWLFNFIKNRPKVFSGYILSVVGKQIEGYTPDGIVFGSVSGFTQKRCPKFVKDLYSAPSEIFDIDDYSVRNYAIMRLGIERNITLIVTANPSTMVELQHNVDRWWDDYVSDIENGTMGPKMNIPDDIRRALVPYLKPNPERAEELRTLKAKYGRVLPKHFWPNLQILTTWKCGNTKTCLDKLEGCYPDGMLHQEFAYFSSECRSGLVLDDSLETCLFPHMHYFEFKKADEFDDPDARFYQLHELKEGEKYCPFVTTFSGLYRYNMNDIIQVGSPFVNTPRVHMVQKVNGIVTITGEKLYEKQFIDAVHQAEKQTGLATRFFIGFANLEASNYDFYYEFADLDTTQEQAEMFTKQVDENLKKMNVEYLAKRESLRLKDANTHRLIRESFETFKAQCIAEGARDGQFKLLLLLQDEKRHAKFKKLTID